jgi:8-oxo-dGTP diphosphatase
VWRGDQDERPLSDFGKKQAEALRDALLDAPIDRLFASPALRCRMTLEPIAEATGLEIETISALAEEQANEVHGAMRVRAEAGLHEIALRQPTGRVIACTHGDVIPAVGQRIARSLGVDLPLLSHRGQRYHITVGEGFERIEIRGVANFPL